jgi:SAM-dependent methyltransferase
VESCGVFIFGLALHIMETCVVCGGSNLTEKFDGTLLECTDCSHVAANMQVDAETLKKIYSVNYFMGEEYADYLADKPMLQQNFRNRLKTAMTLNPKPEFKHVLEIGCAYGFFAELLNREYSPGHYVGVDVVAEAITYGRYKLHQNVLLQDYLSMPAPEEPYSDVFLWDVIEHLPNPEKFMEKLAAETAPGARIYITTGDIGSRLAKIQGAGWRMIHPPSHLHYFTSRSMKQLAEKFGFHLELLSYPPVSRSIRVIFYSLFMLNKPWAGALRRLYTLIPEKASVSVNTYDIMFFIGRKG